MASPSAERAIEDATSVGRAILKILSPNDVGATRSHQRGYLLPNAAWRLFSPHPPDRGRNAKSDVRVIWPDGDETQSVVTWYGEKKQEYRLTNFGRRRGFPWLTPDLVGSLMVLVPRSLDCFFIHVLDVEDDIEDVQAALDVQLTYGAHGGAWTKYAEGEPEPEHEDDCVNRHFRAASRELASFPDNAFFSRTTWATLRACISDFNMASADERLLRLRDEEFRLYRLVEQRLRYSEIHRLFKSVDDFIATGLRILNSRKARAGRSLENHVEFLLRDAHLPVEMRAPVPGRPDVLIPGADAYNNGRFPDEKLFAVGVKTTCKDRWRQVLREAPRARRKYILTLQASISRRQLDEMAEAGVSLIVPARLQEHYPEKSKVELLTLESFIARVRKTLA